LSNLFFANRPPTAEGRDGSVYLRGNIHSRPLRGIVVIRRVALLLKLNKGVCYGV